MTSSIYMGQPARTTKSDHQQKGVFAVVRTDSKMDTENGYHSSEGSIDAGSDNMSDDNNHHDRASDDTRLIELRHAGSSFTAIADIFARENRGNLRPDSLKMRFARLKQRIEIEEEEDLDDALSDWHEGEDDMLKQCLEEVNDVLAEEIDRLHHKKWRMIASLLAVKLQHEERKYSGNACFDRHTALISNTALRPIEEDPNHEARRIASRARIAAAKANRIAGRDDARRDEEASKAERAARSATLKAIKIEKVQRRAQRQEAREQEASRKMDIKERKKLDKAAAKEGQRIWNVRTDWHVQVQKLEDKILQELEGKMPNTMGAITLDEEEG